MRLRDGCPADLRPVSPPYKKSARLGYRMGPNAWPGSPTWPWRIVLCRITRAKLHVSACLRQHGHPAHDTEVIFVDGLQRGSRFNWP